MRSIKSLLYWFVVADLFLIAFSMYQGWHWLFSSQSAFIASLLVTLGSFYSYKRLVEKRIASGDIPAEDRDLLDEVEDRHALFENESEEERALDLKEVIQEERAKIGGFKSGAQHVAKTFGAIISPFRLGGYLFLVLSFLYLNRHGMLEIWGFISGLFVVPLVSLFAGKGMKEQM